MTAVALAREARLDVGWVVRSTLDVLRKRAMDLLLQCNRQLIFSGLDEALILQQALIKIIGRAEPRPVGT